MDADGQMNPDDLPELIKPVADGEVDYSKGNRLIVLHSSKKIPFVRFFGNSVLSLLTKIVSGYWHIGDAQNNYSALSKRALHAIDWDDMYKGYGQPNDILVRLNIYNFIVRDIPMEPVYNVGQQSKMKIKKVMFTIPVLLFRLFFYRMKEKYVKRDFHPLVFFYGLSLMLGAMTIFFLIRLIVLWSQAGVAPPMTSLALVFSVIATLQTLFFAMWFDMESNKDLR